VESQCDPTTSLPTRSPTRSPTFEGETRSPTKPPTDSPANLTTNLTTTSVNVDNATSSTLWISTVEVNDVNDVDSEDTILGLRPLSFYLIIGGVGGVFLALWCLVIVACYKLSHYQRNREMLAEKQANGRVDIVDKDQHPQSVPLAVGESVHMPVRVSTNLVLHDGSVAIDKQEVDHDEIQPGSLHPRSSVARSSAARSSVAQREHGYVRLSQYSHADDIDSDDMVVVSMLKRRSLPPPTPGDVQNDSDYDPEQSNTDSSNAGNANARRRMPNRQISPFPLDQQLQRPQSQSQSQNAHAPVISSMLSYSATPRPPPRQRSNPPENANVVVQDNNNVNPINVQKKANINALSQTPMQIDSSVVKLDGNGGSDAVQKEPAASSPDGPRQNSGLPKRYEYDDEGTTESDGDDEKQMPMPANNAELLNRLGSRSFVVDGDSVSENVKEGPKSPNGVAFVTTKGGSDEPLHEDNEDDDGGAAPPPPPPPPPGAQ